MALNSADKNTVEACLDRYPGAWNHFVNENINLVYHTIHHSAYRLGYKITFEDVEDIASEIFLEVLKNNLAFMQAYRGESKLSTYLCVLAQRTAVREIAKRVHYTKSHFPLGDQDIPTQTSDQVFNKRLDLKEAISQLQFPERKIVSLFYLEGYSYKSISEELGIAMNSIGPILTKARLQLKFLLG